MSTNCIVNMNGYGGQTRLPSCTAMPNSAPKPKAFYSVLLIPCLPNLSLLFLPIVRLSYPSQYLDYIFFSEAKTIFFVVSLYRNCCIIIMLCCPLRSTCCAVIMYQLSWSYFLIHKHRIKYHQRNIGKPVLLC